MDKNQKTVNDVLSDVKRENMTERLNQIKKKILRYEVVLDALEMEAELLEFRLGGE